MSFKAGFVGLIGLPNSGKSTLTNLLVGEKVSIVSSKPQTTRKNITGIYTNAQMQAVFLDAPGLIYSQSGLNLFLNQEFNKALEDSDVLLCILACDEVDLAKWSELVNQVKKADKPWAVVFTKVDLLPPKYILQIEEFKSKLECPLLMVSASKRPEDAKTSLYQLFSNLLPEATNCFYDEDLITTQNVRDMVKETIREKCFEFLFQEIPYGLDVRISKFDESQSNITRIYAQIIVAKERHQKIVIGEKGALIKKIGTYARKDIENLVGTKVFLDLHVAVRKDWVKNKNMLKEFGYVDLQ